MTYPHCQPCVDSGGTCPSCAASSLQVRFVPPRAGRMGVGGASYAATWPRLGVRAFASSGSAWSVWHWPSRTVRRALWRRFEMAERPVSPSPG